MAKILLVAVNASYSHTCLAVRGLCEYVRAQRLPNVEIDFKEVTINQPFGDILREIAGCQPDVVLFSTYIWNGEMTGKIIMDLKKVIPGVIIGGGGPEFGFTAKKYLGALSDLDFIMKGEGERTVTEICRVIGENHFTTGNCLPTESATVDVEDHLPTGSAPAGMEAQLSSAQSLLENIKGIYYRKNGEIVYTGDRDLICNLGELPFPYPFLRKPELLTGEQRDHKIYYYESSRGCPYSCSYCMSSLDKRVRFMPLERVFEDLQIFLDAGVGLVKFVDRTYNLQPERYIAIWDYILKHHNGKTMFHFEIEAEYLSEEALEFLQKVPAGVMQFEIGVQSSNKKTLKAICRSDNIEKLAENVKRIPHTIHQHLDLIAGLPYEDLESFGHSFDFVMSMRPDALQLGFLKVLSGTAMENYAGENGWKWMENPVYETFSTPYMSYSDMMFLKDVEVVVDAYWNSGVFKHFMNYVIRCGSSIWEFFRDFTLWGRGRGVFADARRETFWFGLMYDYIEETHVGVCNGDAGTAESGTGGCKTNIFYADANEGCSFKSDFSSFNKSLLYDLLRYDFIIRGKQGNFPEWYEHRYNKENHRNLLESCGGITNARLDFAHSEYEVFDWNVDSKEPENHKGTYEKLIRYKKKN